MVADIERVYANGRLLLIGTTNIVAARPTIWNLGAIAGSGRPEAATLLLKVLLASATISTLFPPVPMDLEVDWIPLRELQSIAEPPSDSSSQECEVSLATTVRGHFSNARSQGDRRAHSPQ